ncbi:hypothetical protein [Allomuricauda sp. SCSIO 65647]|uniref:hypothetical protein n=1 Tax=Allomuricauda sp. SCSIO 65647 TaxID=2908843 RepID=UPI001F17E4F7|nr:hypothetical protein [Muricauda sp. SCSIO 65647]UJH66167.1 hypothetical protein L0P89_09290 [Muricauda sp. SCSIO 65647]
MKRFLHTLFFCVLIITGLDAQTQTYEMGFEHFQESRGDTDNELIAKLPYSEVVLLHNSLNSRSSLGATLNFHGNVVVIDQMDIMPDGSTQIIIRREDGKNFFGYTPTLRAVLKAVDTSGGEFLEAENSNNN